MLDSGRADSTGYPATNPFYIAPSTVTHPSAEAPEIRPFAWTDLPSLHGVMVRAGETAYAFTDDPLAALEADLRHPRTEATSDVFVGGAGDRLAGWVRVRLELNIGRAVAEPGADPATVSFGLWTGLLEAALERAREACAVLVHVPVPGDGGDLASAARSLSMRPARVSYWMEYHPAPAYLRGDYRPLPEGYSLRAMAGDGEPAALTALQNAAFEGSWGYSPNSVEEIAGWLALPGTGADSVLFAVDRDDHPVAYVWTRFEPSEGMSVGHIGMTGVHPDHRRAGLGTLTVAAGIRHLRQLGAGVVRLEVDRDNRAARRLYRDLGFRRASETVWYELRLAPANGG